MAWFRILVFGKSTFVSIIFVFSRTLFVIECNEKVCFICFKSIVYLVKCFWFCIIVESVFLWVKSV